jgi:glycosyltransferase involved in cell wall biosynthesis
MRDSNLPLNVCHVFASLEGGRWVYEQLQALRDEHGCEVTVVLPPGEGSTVTLCRDAGIRIKRADFTLSGWRSFLTFPMTVLKLAWWMRRERFDVVQSHVITSTVLARPAAWLADVPVRLVMVTGPFYLQAPSFLWMEKATVGMETGVIPSCRLTADLYRQAGLDPKRLLPILYYGPHEKRFDPARTQPAGLRAELGLPAGTPLIASVAVFYSRCGTNSFVPPELHGRFLKGHTDLIQSMHSVRGEFPDAQLLMVGRGWGPLGPETEKELHQFVADEGLADCVHFLGWRPDCPAIYVDIDVSVQASLNENLGGTVESLLMACPTVATRVGGMVDSVIDGETGFLAEPANPEDLGRAIREMLRDKARAKRLGLAGRAHMLAGFTLTTTVPALASIYRDQRAAARGAWRLSRSLLRLLLAGYYLVFVFGRGLFVDIGLKMVAPAHVAAFRARVGRAARRLTQAVRKLRSQAA